MKDFQHLRNGKHVFLFIIVFFSVKPIAGSENPRSTSSNHCNPPNCGDRTGEIRSLCGFGLCFHRWSHSCIKNPEISIGLKIPKATIVKQQPHPIINPGRMAIPKEQKKNYLIGVQYILSLFKYGFHEIFVVTKDKVFWP